MPRRLLRAARFLAAGLLIALLVPMLFEESLIFFPTRYPIGDWEPRELDFQDVWFTAADAVRLHGWYVPAENPRAVALFAHGNAGHLADRADLARVFARELGVSILMFDYRGYGRSEGRPDEPGILADARAARVWLGNRAGVPEREIVLVGESIGGAVIVDLAARDGTRGVILENTFTSIPDVAAFHYPWLPVRTVMRTRLDSLAKIGDYHGPLLQCHGDADSIIPFALGRTLFEAANEPKRLIVVRGGDHNDPRTSEWLAAMDEFFAGLPK
ncbi:MAG: alpha/beta hydrolase [Planctomycetia bacterium]|nr:alpha/beta hydrolase [Planctomycetia bacterium]